MSLKESKAINKKIFTSSYLQTGNNTALNKKKNIQSLFNRSSSEGYERNNFVDIDKTQFSFLLNNLVSNAIRHGITEAFPELQIKFFVRSNGKSIHLIVVNNGCPMDTSITFEKFVTPFFHFGRSGNSGLGGYIINTIIKNHNASFTLNSTIIGSDSFKTVFDFKFKESSKR